ncbi:5-hydroxyisourate hydrolase-like isoform X2 [Suncus etruscus]|uniref:5-hydroxyisourate hydrolase-like isoform X2 n=1 Tax=Suncus etruscus TaxID=109475 RepID=UPI00210F8A49|nr:5-hydroxyisourate hydrolase-like isoform X2 [Suncus etruscus]
MSGSRLRTLQGHLCSPEGRAMEHTTSLLTTHVLDTASGLPAQGLCLQLSRLEDHGRLWTELRKSYTDTDGRCPGLLPPGQMKVGTYKLFFDTESYWRKRGQESFYPYVEVRPHPPIFPAKLTCFEVPEERSLGPFKHTQSIPALCDSAPCGYWSLPSQPSYLPLTWPAGASQDSVYPLVFGLLAMSSMGG